MNVKVFTIHIIESSKLVFVWPFTGQIVDLLVEQKWVVVQCFVYRRLFQKGRVK